MKLHTFMIQLFCNANRWSVAISSHSYSIYISNSYTDDRLHYLLGCFVFFFYKLSKDKNFKEFEPRKLQYFFRMRFLISRAVILLSALILVQQELAEAQKLEDAASKVNLENINGLEFLNLLVEKLRNCERNASTSSNNLASELEKARKEVIKLTAANQNLTIELGNLRRDFKLGVRTNATSPKKPNNLTLNGYVETPGLGTYKIYTTAKNWTDAKRACDRDGAYLGVPNSEAAAKLFAGMTSRALAEIKEASDPRYAWVGVSDRLEEGRWVTVFGNSINSTGFYNHWRPNLSHGTSFNCGALMDLTEPVGLIDWRCADKFAYICEF